MSRPDPDDRLAGTHPRGRTVDDADLRADLLHAQETTRESLDEVRRLARRLRPGVLEDLGLVSALTALVTDLSTCTGLAILHDFQPGLPAMNEQTELVVHRVAQEVLTNVAATPRLPASRSPSAQRRRCRSPDP